MDSHCPYMCNSGYFNVYTYKIHKEKILIYVCLFLSIGFKKSPK